MPHKSGCLHLLGMRLALTAVTVTWLAWESWYRPLSWSFFLALAMMGAAVVHLLRVPPER